MNTVEVTYYILLHGSTKLKVSVSQNCISVLGGKCIYYLHTSALSTQCFIKSDISECRTGTIHNPVFTETILKYKNGSVILFIETHNACIATPKADVSEKFNMISGVTRITLEWMFLQETNLSGAARPPCSYTSAHSKSNFHFQRRMHNV